MFRTLRGGIRGTVVARALDCWSTGRASDPTDDDDDDEDDDHFILTSKQCSLRYKVQLKCKITTMSNTENLETIDY